MQRAAASGEPKGKVSGPPKRSEAHPVDEASECWGSQRAAKKMVSSSETHAVQESVAVAAVAVDEQSKNSFSQVSAYSAPNSTPLTHHLDTLCYQGLFHATNQEDVKDAAADVVLMTTFGLTTSMAFESPINDSMVSEIA